MHRGGYKFPFVQPRNGTVQEKPFFMGGKNNNDSH